MHGSEDKPFGCIASPFTLNKQGTLIVRNRYRLLKCYGDEPTEPAYRVFRQSLDMLFGNEEATRLCEHLDNGGGDITGYMHRTAYEMLLENDAIKQASGEIHAPEAFNG